MALVEEQVDGPTHLSPSRHVQVDSDGIKMPCDRDPGGASPYGALEFLDIERLSVHRTVRVHRLWHVSLRLGEVSR